MYPPSAAAAAAWSDGTLPLANGPGRGAVLWRLVRHRAMERRGLGLLQSPMLIMRPVLPPLEVSYLREERVHAAVGTNVGYECSHTHYSKGVVAGRVTYIVRSCAGVRTPACALSGAKVSVSDQFRNSEQETEALHSVAGMGAL